MSKATIELFDDKVPCVHYTQLAYRQRQHIVATNKEEVGWFGTGDELENGDYLIDRLYVPSQEVHATECEIDDDATTDFSEALIADNICPSRFILWGHSHVNMSVNPSGTDDDQLIEYLKYANTFIRAIHNKKGEERHDIYLKDKGYMVSHAPSGVYVPPLDKEELAQLNTAIKVNVQPRPYPVYGGKNVGKQAGTGELMAPSNISTHKPKTSLYDQRKESREFWLNYDACMDGDEGAVEGFFQLYGYNPIGVGYD